MLRPVVCTTTMHQEPKHARNSSPLARPQLNRGGVLLSKWRMTAGEKAAKQEQYRSGWGKKVEVLQHPGAPNSEDAGVRQGEEEVNKLDGTEGGGGRGR